MNKPSQVFLWDIIWRIPTYCLSPSVSEVLPKQETQLSEDSHVDVFPTSLSQIQLLTVDPRRQNWESTNCKLVYSHLG